VEARDHTLETGRGKTTPGLCSGKMLKHCFGKKPHSSYRRSKKQERSEERVSHLAGKDPVFHIAEAVFRPAKAGQRGVLHRRHSPMGAEVRSPLPHCPHLRG